MNLTVLGANGRTGALLVDRALRAGHRVTAAVRRPESVGVRDPNLRVLAADMTSAASMKDVIAGSDAVCSVLGVAAPRRPTTLYSESIAAVIEAMDALGMRRVVAVTAIPAEPDELKTALERRVVHPMLHLFFGGGYADMVRMERRLADSDTDWTVLRPPRLTNAAPKGRHRMAVDARLAHAGSLPRADLAAALLDAAADPQLNRHGVNIAT